MQEQVEPNTVVPKSQGKDLSRTTPGAFVSNKPGINATQIGAHVFIQNGIAIVVYEMASSMSMVQAVMNPAAMWALTTSRLSLSISRRFEINIGRRIIAAVPSGRKT
jgi:hypothetical protein